MPGEYLGYERKLLLRQRWRIAQFGVLFGCNVTGNGAVGGCFSESALFDSRLPPPRARVAAQCVGAHAVDGAQIPVTLAIGSDAQVKALADAEEFRISATNLQQRKQPGVHAREGSWQSGRPDAM